MQRVNTIKPVLLILLISWSGFVFGQDNRISIYSGQKIFSSGMNMAWGNFAQDATNLNEATFIQALDEISAAGGNSMRWWLHVNGTSSPQYANDTVSAISQTEIDNVRRILDLAYERKMVICISLWSHDMLNGSNGNNFRVDENLLMLSSLSASMAYINNALIPLVDALKGHPGILCWEIFNEPEGMIEGYGWTGNTAGGAWTTYPDIKRFTNLCAGAIHRTDPNALVTTGTHKASYLAYHYTDNILIAAGGDSLGTLDFYQAHYYSGFGEIQSPFAHPYSYWGLDKPMVVGEFSAHGPNGATGSPNPQQAYQYLYDNGYAGAWSWTWTGHDGNGDVSDAQEGMLPLAQNYPDDILIKYPAGWLDTLSIEKSRIILGDSTQVKWVTSDSSVVTLNAMPFAAVDSTYLSPESTTDYTLLVSGDFHSDTVHFTITVLQPGNIEYFTATRQSIETGDSTMLKWSVVGGDVANVTLNDVPVAAKDSLYVSPVKDSLFILATDGPSPDTSRITITVLNELSINRALNNPAFASTFETCCGPALTANFAVDGDLQTRWSSAWGTGDPADPNTDADPNDEWIYVDLGKNTDIENVILFWEAAYGSAYDLDVSWDGYLWKTVFSETAGNGGQDNITFTDRPSGRYLRMHGKNRGTVYGYSLYEFEAYGVTSQKIPPAVSLSTNKSNVLQAESSVTVTADATDADGTILQVDFYVDGALIATDNEAPFETVWQAGNASVYGLTAVAMDDDSLSVQTDTFNIYIYDDSFVRYEAEDAATTGQATRVNNPVVSGRAYMDLKDAWTITWNNINVAQGGQYLLTIGYQLTYDIPKSQYLVVNGDTVDVIEFIAPNTSVWLQRGLFVPLAQGANTIALHGFWNWMSLDFIAVRGATIVSLEDKTEIPDRYALLQNYPNPFNPQTTIAFMLKKKEKATLTIYNALGRKIKTLYNAIAEAGMNSVKWDGLNDAGTRVSSGVYFYHLQTESGYKKIKKMIFIK